MVRGRARHARCWLDHIQPVHRIIRPTEVAPPRELFCVRDVPWSICQKIRIQRQNHIRLARLINCVHRAAKRQFRAFFGPISDCRFPLVPLRLRISSQQLANLPDQSRRSYTPSQNTEALAVRRLCCGRQRLCRIQERRPRPYFAAIHHRLCAIWIVQVEYRSLHKRARRTQARRVIRVTFDLRRTAFVTLHQHANRISCKRHRRGIEIRSSQRHSIRLFHIRRDMRFIRPSTTGHARQRQRSSHQFQEIPAVHRIVPFRCLSREFAVQQSVKMRIFRQLFQRPPIFLA